MINCHSFSGSAKPSNLRARFENFAKEKEEEDLRRTTEQKRIREEKDRLDREQALQSQQNGTKNAAPATQTQRKSIETGRTGSIGNAINLFNKADNEPVVPVQRVIFIKAIHNPSNFSFNYKNFVYRKSQSNCRKKR